MRRTLDRPANERPGGRRPDVVPFYKAELPALFAFDALLVVFDGVAARISKLTAGREWFKPWRTISRETLANSNLPELDVMLDGVFDKRRLLDLIGHFVVFEDVGVGPLVKKMDRLPARQAGEGDADGARAGGGAVGVLGCSLMRRRS